MSHLRGAQKTAWLLTRRKDIVKELYFRTRAMRSKLRDVTRALVKDGRISVEVVRGRLNIAPLP